MRNIPGGFTQTLTVTATPGRVGGRRAHATMRAVLPQTRIGAGFDDLRRRRAEHWGEHRGNTGNG